LTSLFCAPQPVRRRFSAYAFSLILHGISILLLSYGLLYAPLIQDEPIRSHYKVRHLDLHAPETAANQAAEALYPNAKPPAPKNPDAPTNPKPAPQQAAGTEPKPHPLRALKLPTGGEGKQTLVQPQLHTHEALAEEAPVPTFMIWTPPLAPTIKIVPPRPDKPTTVDANPSLEVPNEELDLADLPETAANRQPPVPTPPAGNTSPVIVKGSETVKMAPATVSTSSDQPTPTAVLSVSDVRINQGTVVLPPVNETKGTEKGEGAASGKQSSAAVQPARVLGAGGSAGSPSAVAQSAPIAADGQTTEHIQLPKGGKFSVVVVGSSLADQYPETLQIWSDRVAYTAYLHIGLPKAWILQFSQLRSADAASGGAVDGLEAPWPYDIQRPNLLSQDINADALMVHGVLNESGRLEQLAIAYPQGFSHGSFVLNSLRQWQFRPARRQGKPTPVEILLIIPDETD
jgi:hypothetical protein